MKVRGFTLIELLIYIGIVAVLLLSLSVFLRALLEARIKNQIIAEVEGQGTVAMQIITQTLLNATTLNSPAIGVGSTSLSVDTPTVALNPTIFDLSGGALRIKEGSGVNVNLTSSQVVVSNLNFYNLSAVGTHGIIRVQFDLSYNSLSTNYEYQFTKKFIGSVSLR